ncbi:MAG: wax ester/triacylglycerol synthase family O-acyltransferase, partial [Lysobacterales bacterium]
MKQLTGVDAMFLHLDNPRASTGGTLVLVYDQTTRPNRKPLRFKEILGYLEERMDQLPVLQKKLVRVPFNLDHPYWIRDRHFNLEHHVHHIRLPKPGDWRQFCIMAARLTTPHFDFNRPLWEMYVVEGLDNVDWLPDGSFAILVRMHHALVDGTAAVQLISVLHELSPNRRRRRRPRNADASDKDGGEDPPSLASMMFRAGINNTSSLLRLVKPIYRLASAIGPSWAMNLMERSEQDELRVPRTRFNSSVCAYRVFADQIYSLDVFRSYKALVEGATINDAVVSVISGAVRRYLEAKNELPEDSLVAMMPVNTRQHEGENRGGGNAITLTTASIHSDIADPVQRLQAIRGATSRMKAFISGVGSKEMTDLTRFAPEATLAFAGKLIALTHLDFGRFSEPKFNIGISNVPGPQQPLYLKGAVLRHFSVVAPVTDGMGLGVGVASYNGTL